jgi:hypothetical protein
MVFSSIRDLLTPERRVDLVSSRTREGCDSGARATGKGRAGTGIASGRFGFMKPFVVRCPVTPMPEGVVVPPDGASVYLECPCCRAPHRMMLRDAKHFRRAS